METVGEELGSASREPSWMLWAPEVSHSRPSCRAGALWTAALTVGERYNGTWLISLLLVCTGAYKPTRCRGTGPTWSTDVPKSPELQVQLM